VLSSLKPRASATDEPGMFRRQAAAAPLEASRLQRLCLSLNAPVLHLDELPVGPARAGIAVYADAEGGLGLAIGLRASEGGAVARYGYAGDARDFRDADHALDAALTFAERLGFLFDEDVVARAGRDDALRQWAGLLGERGGEPPPPAPLGSETLESLEAPAADVVELVEAVEPAKEPEVRPAPVRRREPARNSPETGSARPLPPSRPAPAGQAPPLTKFRSRPPERAPSRAPSAAAAGAGEVDPSTSGRESRSGSALGRIPLVRRRRSGGEGPLQRAAGLLRLLAQF